MTLTWSRLLAIHNAGALVASVALVGLAPAIIYLARHGMFLTDRSFPAGYYEWYRGPSYDMDTKHKVKLEYDSANEYMLYTAAAICALSGLVGIIGFFFTFKTNKPTSQKSTLYLQVLPGTLSLIVSLIAFAFSRAVYDTNNKGKCYWEQGYNPNNVFKCTRELATCNIAIYFKKDDSRLAEFYASFMRACRVTQTGRHLVTPLFVAGILLFSLSVGKLLVEKKQSVFVESADERVERLERQED